ncbi:hypothetical protein RhiXN_02351 [Rhizoctonia solani]|uniref:Fungal N-terminal domain-containing protein n=1 Tax=Rhizoctonia solani TaxID=456999 RepID=A0A8H8PD22_9AGAM|nr:uncharacterized protein RhiXN_02351 [Rhizoctonia solani]QRW27756.1 hypothetical protein RhiXN_02351 [Rhizoctonia solani]
MSSNQSDYNQQIFGTVTNAISIGALFLQLSNYVNAKSTPDPAKELSKRGGVLTAQELKDFEGRCTRLEVKLQKEEERIGSASQTKSEKSESINNLRRIHGTIRSNKKDLLSSSTKARGMRSVSSIQVNEVVESTTTNTSSGISSVSQRVREMYSFQARTTSILPTHIDPSTQPIGGSSRPISSANVENGYYFSYNQEDGTERRVHSEDLKRDPSIAPELVDVIIRTSEALRQGAPMTLGLPPSDTTAATKNQSIPVYKLKLDLISE